MDIQLLKNEERLGSGEVEHEGGGVGENDVGEGGSEIFDDILGRESELFHPSS